MDPLGICEFKLSFHFSLNNFPIRIFIDLFVFFFFFFFLNLISCYVVLFLPFGTDKTFQDEFVFNCFLIYHYKKNVNQ